MFLRVKHRWDADLDELKQHSLGARQSWVAGDRRTQGDLFALMYSAKSAYKLVIKKKRVDDRVSISNRLHELLLGMDEDSFWNLEN